MAIYVQRQGEEYGPYEDADVKKHLAEGFLLSSDLARSDGDQDWTRLDDLVDARSRPPAIPRQRQPRPKYRHVEESSVAFVLTIIAVMELIVAPIAGIAVGQESTFTGWMIFLSGLISGLILLGFATVIEHTYESAQRLRHIEFVLCKDSDDKKDA